MESLPSNRRILKLKQTKPFWFLASVLVLSVLIALFCLYLLDDEERRRINERTLVLAIPAEGEFYLRRDKISLADLAPSVKKLMETEGTGQMIYIKPGLEVEESTISAAIDLLQKAGQDRIGLPTEMAEGGLHRSGSIDTAILVSTVRCDQIQHRAPVVLLDEEAATANTVSLNGKQIQVGDLSFELKSAFNRIEERIAYVNTGKHVLYGQVIAILAMIKRAGANEIAFVLECDTENPNRLVR